MNLRALCFDFDPDWTGFISIGNLVNILKQDPTIELSSDALDGLASELNYTDKITYENLIHEVIEV